MPMLRPISFFTLAIEEMRGEPQLLTVDGATIPTLQEAALCLPGDTPVASLPVGPGHLINPRWALRESIVTFADFHNAMLIDRSLGGDWGACVRFQTLPEE